MNINPVNKVPLMAVPRIQETALQKKLDADLPSEDQEDRVILSRVGSESATFREKGELIDVYI